MINLMQCGTGSYHRAALVVAAVDIIVCSLVLILLVLGTSLLAAFEFIADNPANATRVLDEITGDLFGSSKINSNFSDRAETNVGEDLGVFLIITFLALVDFIISCIFFDGVKSRKRDKCQAWFSVRLVITVVFLIVVGINVSLAASISRYIPLVVISVYRIVGILTGYAFLAELRQQKAQEKCLNCGVLRSSSRLPSATNSIINLSARRKEAEEAFRKNSSSPGAPPPILMITGPEDSTNSPTYSTTGWSSHSSTPQSSPSVSSSRRSSNASTIVLHAQSFGVPH